MRNINERPVCHRAEDLVTYLYGEASVAEARDFATHMEQCDACRAEFALFNQVHDSIVTWRNQALGASTVAVNSPAFETAAISNQPVPHARRLSAWASLREFFSVSPLWLRGASAFAALLLGVLLIFAAARFWQKPAEVAKTNGAATTNKEAFDRAVREKVQEELARMNRPSEEAQAAPAGSEEAGIQKNLATTRTRSKRNKGLSREERVQLAADLGLIPGREEEIPFVLPEEPNQ